MSMTWILAGLIACFWGISWALFLEFHPWGKWMVIRRTWQTVVIGVGVTLGIALIAVHWFVVLGLVWLFSLSGAGVIIRALYHEWKEEHG